MGKEKGDRDEWIGDASPHALQVEGMSETKASDAAGPNAPRGPHLSDPLTGPSEQHSEQRYFDANAN